MSSRDLSVASVDFRALENAETHLTDQYEWVQLSSEQRVVLRRGQRFNIEVHFRQGSYDANHHGLNILFDFAAATAPSPREGTRGEARLNREGRMGWAATLKESKPSSAVVQVQSPSTAPVGEWKVTFVIYNRQRGQYEYRFPGHFYLLFNPWNSADQVYMPEEKLLDEYVYNDVGKLYQQKDEGVWGQHWTFGQFDKWSTAAAMFILDQSALRPADRGNPVKVCRAITYMVNGLENPKGILEGLWPPDDFPQPSTRPTEWTSSVDILREYMENNGRTVKYGQCWVFAGVVTTVCRSLGLATRAVTTFESAHDGDSDLAISKFYDENNVKQRHPTYSTGKDLQWTFHVWNEVWMARPELAHGYGGWQAIDGTPQSPSNGRYQCGPAPLAAIKRGEVGMPYDVTTYIAATNADLIHWKKTMSGQFRITDVKTDRYGTSVLTKKPYTFDPNGETDQEEVKDNYKYPEGTHGERTFLMKAVRQVPNARTIYNVRREAWRDDLVFEVVGKPVAHLGQDLVIPFKVKNKSNAPQNVKASVTASSFYYNGAGGYYLGRTERELNLGPQQEERISLRISQSDYVGKLVEYGAVHAYAALSVTGTNQTLVREVTAGFLLPKLTIEPVGDVRLGRMNTLRLRFTNPLNVRLTGCNFHVFAPGITVARTTPFRPINPLEQVRIEVNFQPYETGDRKLTVTFACREIVNLIGRVNIQV